MTKVSIAVGVNSEEILNECLLASPDIASGRLPLKIYRGYSVFAEMGNTALAESDADWLVILHQDIYLPTGFADRLESVLTSLENEHPEAAVLGVIGLGFDGQLEGRVWSSGLQGVVGKAEPVLAQVQTLDECLLVVRRSVVTGFDPNLPSFHLYGTDVILNVQERGHSAWVADLPVIHHSRKYHALGKSYRTAWFYMRRKWRHRLPLANLVCTVSWSPLSLYWLDYRIQKRSRKWDGRPKAVGHPVEIARSLGWERN
jgi:hypothetical protein